ncbi:MAG: alkene reductase [Burkholderiales bacterium RIFCSPHIGHO2_12_FULL_65_48]|nr:MAG: alkene reductase [Burkholderiales bacterium RIFCSPHIGHO2_02_FULL_64_19]OGB23878.1 MAG: alkene reductase [Burkholderiales bacterium RIFCSPHIGHO2_12_FULL_65_48]OGB59328.1 MAG: alkene reductase [Burkholderiales bacterium RIFCSPLOWO2_12_FULL_64_33]
MTRTATSPLFAPLALGPLTLPNRMVMAPMTRARSTQPGDVPNAMMATYYAQRASAGLIVSEATQISRQGQGYSFTPGIYTEAQVQGWRRVTNAVHTAGGRMVLQLWHVGRMSHPSFHADGLPVAPSALSPEAKVWVVGYDGVGRMVDSPVPRALSTAEIAGVIDDFRRAAANAMRAGFDGVEIHGANGYLIDQFLRTTSNHRTDAYGGTMDNRTRFAREVAAAVASEAGAERTGMRLAPFITQRNMNCPEIIPTMLHLARQLDTLGLAYIHLAEADWDDAPSIPDDFRQALRNAYSGRVIVAGKYTPERAQQILSSGMADLVAFGRPFIANPDLLARYAAGLPLAAFDPATLFGGTEHGYSDYSAARTTAAQQPAAEALA